MQAWIDPAAIPGKYKVEYVINAGQALQVQVRGVLYTRFGAIGLPLQTLRTEANREVRAQAATVQIAEDGQVSVQ